MGQLEEYCQERRELIKYISIIYSCNFNVELLAKAQHAFFLLQVTKHQ